MTAEQINGFTGWAIVEQLGHKTLACFVREVQLAGVPMLRLDVPDGEKPITESAVATQFIHASTLYALTPTTEAVVRKASARTVAGPAVWGLTALPEPSDPQGEGEYDEPQSEADVIGGLLSGDLEEDSAQAVVRVLTLMQQHTKDWSDASADHCRAILGIAIEAIQERRELMWVEHREPARS